MRDFRQIIVVLKGRLLAGSAKERIYDKDVAKLLNISQSRFATIKKRNTTPFIELLHYCHKENICCSEIFFEQ